MEGLRRHGESVRECHIPFLARTERSAKSLAQVPFLLFSVFRLAFIQVALVWKALSGPSFDVLVVGYPGHHDMLAAKLICLIKRKPLVFDVFISLYDTLILDRKLAASQSGVGIVFRYLDKFSCF